MNISWRNTPEGVALHEILTPFEGEGPDFNQAIKRYIEYALDALEFGDPQWEYLSFPKNWLHFSRIGRQYSGVLIPDEIHKPYEIPPKPLTEETFYRGLSYSLPEIFGVEDLLSRQGVRKYYFKQSGVTLRNPALTREYLWPADADFFLMVTKCLLMLGPDLGCTYPGTGYPLTRVPKRPDLVDTGYHLEKATHPWKVI